jgi:hypothetical protein
MSTLFDANTFLDSFRSDRLPSVQRYLPGSVSDDYLLGKLLAAEAQAQRKLHVFLTPTVLFPNDPTQAEIDSLAGAAWAVDPGYDYEQDMIQPGGWIFLKLRQRPVISLQSIQYAYPSVGTIFSVPDRWIKTDKKYGHIRFFPAGVGFNTPIGGALIGAMGMQGVPQFIEVRYTAGLKDVATNYPDLLDVVQRMVLAGLMNDSVLAASTSISADGLSQSISAPDLDKFREGIDSALDDLRTRIHGIPMMVL